MGTLSVVTLVILVSCLTQDVFSAVSTVSHFSIKVKERGMRYKEHILIDENKQTEIYQVPAHHHIGKAEVMNDFKLGLTIYRLHDVATCYVSRLQTGELNPTNLKNVLQKSSSTPRAVTKVSTEWIPTGSYPRRLLRKEVLNFCGKYPIYKVEPYSGDDSMAVSKDKGRTTRQAQSLVMCRNFSSYNLRCSLDNVSFSCKVRTKCATFRVICKPSRRRYEFCSSYRHLYNSFVCCDPYCP